MYLRYYYATYEDDFGLKPKLIPLLEEVKRDHGIDYEALHTDGEKEQEHYDLFSNRSRTLNRRTGQKVRKNLASVKGNPLLFQTVALMDEDVPQYYVKGKEECIEFLNKLLSRGQEYLRELLETDQRTLESDTIRDFRNSGVVKGQFKENVLVGLHDVKRKFETSKYTVRQYELAKNVAAKKIDLICEQGGETWIFEVKKEFTSDSVEQALGQVLIYDYLFNEDNITIKTRKGVIFGTNPLTGDWGHLLGKKEAFDNIQRVFAAYGIKVFVKGIDF